MLFKLEFLALVPASTEPQVVFQVRMDFASLDEAKACAAAFLVPLRKSRGAGGIRVLEYELVVSEEWLAAEP